MNQIIVANCLEFWIREKSKSVSSFLKHVLASLHWYINADPTTRIPAWINLFRFFTWHKLQESCCPCGCNGTIGKSVAIALREKGQCYGAIGCSRASHERSSATIRWR